MFQTGRRIREGLLNLPDRLSDILAAERDQAKIHAIISKEIRQILEALTDGHDHDAKHTTQVYDP
jgi:hypothetical protein